MLTFLFQYVNLIRTQAEGFVQLLTCSGSIESITYSQSFTYLLTYLCIVTMPTCDMSVLTMLYNTDTCAIHLHTSAFSWRRSVVACVVRRMNEVTLRRARLVLGWATVFGRVQPSRYVTSQLGQLSLASLQDKLPRRKYHAWCYQINHCLL